MTRETRLAMIMVILTPAIYVGSYTLLAGVYAFYFMELMLKRVKRFMGGLRQYVQAFRYAKV